MLGEAIRSCPLRLSAIISGKRRVPRVSVTLYAIPPSHPSHAARLMLERKGIEHKVVNLAPGTHAAAVRALGFRRGTVPALKLEGRRVQGSRQIARALDEARAEPKLFPNDPRPAWRSRRPSAGPTRSSRTRRAC